MAHENGGEHGAGEEQDEIHACIEECISCHAVCMNTVPYCLETGGAHADAAHVRLLLDCAQACQLSADFMLRGSDYHEEACALCAEVCRACEASCREFADDEDMLACAEVCATCATACEQMADMEQ